MCGHRDREKDYICIDEHVLSLEMFRLSFFLCIGSEYIIGQMNVKSALFQARRLNRLGHVRPNRDAEAHGIVWLLTVTANVLTDYVRL